MAPEETPIGRRSERGTGLLGTTIGMATMLAMLGFAVNVSLGLWTRSTIDSVAYDAARRVATAPIEGQGSDGALAATEADSLAGARHALGPIGATVQLEFEHSGDDGVVVLHVQADGVSLLPRLIDGGPVVGALDRRIVVRRETE